MDWKESLQKQTMPDMVKKIPQVENFPQEELPEKDKQENVNYLYRPIEKDKEVNVTYKDTPLYVGKSEALIAPSFNPVDSLQNDMFAIDDRISRLEIKNDEITTLNEQIETLKEDLEEMRGMFFHALTRIDLLESKEV